MSTTAIFSENQMNWRAICNRRSFFQYYIIRIMEQSFYQRSGGWNSDGGYSDCIRAF